MSAELLCTEGVSELLLADAALLGDLWTVLDRAPPLHPQMASYFVKVIMLLLTRFTVEVGRLLGEDGAAAEPTAAVIFNQLPP